LLKFYAFFSRQPPFTADQLKALTARDHFIGINTEKVFGISQTPFEQAISETFSDKQYSQIILKR
jgi:hypothetical protein